MNNQKVFFTSDTHYGHANICRGTSVWKTETNLAGGQSTRDFPTLDLMNQAIVDGINNKVGENDILYHLGDWSFGGFDNILKFRERIICKNIHLIFGNHDQHIEKNKLIHTGHDGDLRTQDLFKSCSYVKTVKVGKHKLFCSHYSHRAWDKSHHGRMHLYGHSHSTLEHQEWGKSIDVGIDNYFRLFGRYEPFEFIELYNILSKREIMIIDHHNRNTN